MSLIERLADRLIREGQLQHLALRVGCGSELLAECYRNADEKTLFDMASVTKILSVTQLMLMALEEGKITLETVVKNRWTVRQLMTHTIGIGHRNLCQPTVNDENIAAYIASLEEEIPAGSNVLYSCPAFILLGKVLEELYGERLDVLFRQRVALPLGMRESCFLPTRRQNVVNANKTEEELGLVNDYNCRYLGGVAGNAGVFSCVEELTLFCRMLLREGEPLYKKELFRSAAENHTKGMDAARGLGYLYVDERYPQTGRLFPVGSIGHCGHTGQMLFVHPQSGLYAIVLTDATRHAKQYSDVMKLRELICNTVAEELYENRIY